MGTRAMGALVMGSDYKALGVVRSLGRHGIPVGVLADEHLLAHWSRYCRWHVPWPAVGEAGRVDFLLDLARERNLEGWAIFPTDDETAALLARNRETLGEVFRLTIRVPWDTLRLVYDKRLTYRLADDIAVDHPLTLYPRGRDEVLAYDGAFPVILKPAIRAELNRFTISKAWPASDRLTLVERYEQACTLIDPALIMIQEVIPGRGECQFSYAALCHDGRPLASLVARRTRQWPMDFGRASTYVETIDALDVEETARRLLAAIRFAGVVEVEFKRDPRDGRLKLLDVNPRAWGWHSLGARAGVDFPYLLWLMVTDTAVPELRARPGVRWVRALTDVPTALAEIRAGHLTVGAYLSSLRGPIEFAILAADDPLPALLDLPAAIVLARARKARDAAFGPPSTVEQIARTAPSGSGRS